MGFTVSFWFYIFMIFYPLYIIDREGNHALIVGVMLGIQGIGAWFGRKYIFQLTEHLSPFLVINSGVFISALSFLLFDLGYAIEGVGFFS